MVKLVFLPEDKYFEDNLFQLSGSKSIHHVDVMVDGQATACDGVRILTNGLFAYRCKLSFGEICVKMSAISRVTFWLEV